MFDPYDRWLGIPKDQQPADYFQLLDLDPDETDPRAIRAAAERQAGRITRHEDGPHGKLCARLLGEIELARETLTKPSKRKVYEAELRKPSHTRADADDETRDEDAHRRSGKGKPGKGKHKGHKKEEGSLLWLWLSLGGVGLLLLLGAGVTAIILMRSSKQSPTAQAAAPATAPAPQQTAPPAPPPPPEPKQEPPKAPQPKVETPPAPPPPPPPPPPAPKVQLARPEVVKPPTAVTRLPVPDMPSQDRAEKALKETYQADYGKGKEDNLALAAKLLQPGRENRGDPAAWYVLLREARDLAIRAGKPRLAIEAIDEMDKWFIVDGFALKLQALDAVGQTPEGAVLAARSALSQVEVALSADNYPAVLRLLDAADALARKAKKPDEEMLKRIATRRTRVQGYEKLYQKVTAAREKLKTAPDDREANLAVGRHLCLFHGRWDEGLPFLAKGGDAEPAPLARMDLTPPADVKAQMAVGDGWWALAEGQLHRFQRNLQERAFAWYELAIPAVAGEDQARMVNRTITTIKARAARIPRLHPGSFLGREDLESRTLLLREGGGTMQSEAAVAAGLEWIAKHQHRDGHWGTDTFSKSTKCNCSEPGQKFDVGGTAFGLLPLFGAGETQQRGKYKEKIWLGLRYLMRQQKPEGKFSDNAYENALATMAVCEALGQTRDKRLIPFAQAAVNFIAGAQHPGGSWGYSPGQKGDTSVSGWQFSALKAGAYAGLTVPSSPFLRMGAFLDEVADPNLLGYGYNTRGAGPATTATGLLCREYLGLSPRHPVLAKGIATLIDPNNFVTKEKPSIYFVFYANQVIHHAGGHAWETWNPKLRDLLIELQDKGKTEGREHQKGSWSPAGDPWAVQGGRLMFTSLAVLTLESYYLHVPLNGYGNAVLLE
jgi:hypothetical protein